MKKVSGQKRIVAGQPFKSAEIRMEGIKILAIETSCDETAAAVIGISNNTQKQKNKRTEEQLNFRPVILSNVVSSQVDLHAKTGGVVPEVASRAHLESIIPVIEEALRKANDELRTTNDKQSFKSEIGCHSELDSESYHRVSGRKTNDKSVLQAQDNFLVTDKTPNSKPDTCKLKPINSHLATSVLLQDITHIAVTAGPGLIGSLLVGFNTAKALAYALNLPIIPINHIEGHIYSAFSRINPKSEIRNSRQIQNSKSKNPKPDACNLSTITFPLLALTVSGGHTSLTLMRDHGVYENIGSTLDDAAGEAFDKVAKLLGLGYPGGPAVSKHAERFRSRIKNDELRISNKTPSPNSKIYCHSELDSESHHRVSGRTTNDESIRQAQDMLRMTNNIPNHHPQSLNNEAMKLWDNGFRFPRPLLDQGNFNFSFSGLKTAVLYYVQELTANSYQLTAEDKEKICYEFEEAVVDVLVGKTLKACDKYKLKAVILAGGVAANSRLRERLTEELKNKRTEQDWQNDELRMTNDEERPESEIRNRESDNIELLIPPVEMCGDNAAMIGIAAYYHILRGDTSSWDRISVDSNAKLSA